MKSVKRYYEKSMELPLLTSCIVIENDENWLENLHMSGKKSVDFCNVWSYFGGI